MSFWTWFFVIVGSFFGIICTGMARTRGRSATLGVVGGFIFGIWAVLYYAIVGDTTEMRVAKENKAKGEHLSENDRALLRKEKGGSLTIKMVGLLGLLIIVLVVISSIITSNIKSASDKAKDAVQGSANSGSGTNTNAVAVPTYKLGEAFNIKNDPSEYTKFDWDVTKTSLIKLDSYKKTNQFDPGTLVPKNGKFYIISIEATNRYSEKSYLDIGFADDLILVDSTGKKYSRNNSEAESAYKIYSKKYSSTALANPDESTNVPLLYDVPDQTYKLCDENQKKFCIEGVN